MTVSGRLVEELDKAKKLEFQAGIEYFAKRTEENRAEYERCQGFTNGIITALDIVVSDQSTNELYEKLLALKGL